MEANCGSCSLRALLSCTSSLNRLSVGSLWA
jgi:hypothetical protein